MLLLTALKGEMAGMVEPPIGDGTRRRRTIIIIRVMVYNKEIPQCLPGSRHVVPRRDPIRDGDWPSALERRIVS